MKRDQHKMPEHVCNIDSCQVRDALLIIGGKWKSMILYVLEKNLTIPNSPVFAENDTDFLKCPGGL